MRILLDWKKPEREMSTLLDALAQKHEIVYWVSFKESQAGVKSSAVFHDAERARLAQPAESLDPSSFPLPSAELIHQMRSAESTVLTMMNRKFAALNVDERKHLYYTMLGYWAGVLDTYTPEAIVFNAIPHATYNFILYALAKQRGIKTLMFVDTWEPDRIMPITDYIEGNATFNALVHDNSHKKYTEENLSPALREYYRLQITPKADATPNYIKLQKKEIAADRKISALVFGVMQAIRHGLFLKTVQRRVRGLFVADVKELSKREYASVQTLPDFSAPFVYLALHFQPERTTSPQGDMFVDQVLMIETIAASLPDGWFLYVKEHPMQWWMRGSRDPARYMNVRYSGYYLRVANIPRVKLIPPETDTFTLMQKARAVATVTGTVGFEALMRLKPVLLFGHSWYKFFPSLFRITDVSSCRAALDRISKGFAVDRQDVLHFLKSVDTVVQYAYTDEFGERNSALTSRENIKNVARIIHGALTNSLYEKK